jgi:hypothetical protein
MVFVICGADSLCGWYCVIARAGTLVMCCAGRVYMEQVQLNMTNSPSPLAFSACVHFIEWDDDHPTQSASSSAAGGVTAVHLVDSLALLDFLYIRLLQHAICPGWPGPYVQLSPSDCHRVTQWAPWLPCMFGLKLRPHSCC